VVAVVGATASGKSGLALALAEELGGEVVNTDSMQVYRGMDIGTAKLPVDQRRGVVHHLLDLLDVTEPATVAEFQQWARTAIEDCHHRGVLPVLAGGSVLYTRAVLDRFEFPGTDEQMRAGLEAELSEVGASALHERLRRLDPAAAYRIGESNGRRVVRALEVIAITGRPFSATLPGHEYFYRDALQIGLAVPRPVLDQRIAARVHRMWAAGFVEEVRRLEALGLREGRTANRALGYQQVLAYLDGRLTESEAQEQTIAATRRFVRRQESWLRRDSRIAWVGWDEPDLVATALRIVTAATSAPRPRSH
jgi:tRNA dimethylallyltransferase